MILLSSWAAQPMHISDFHYDLPSELIAQEPLPSRDASRMLIVNRATQEWNDSQFRVIAQFLNSGDLLVINDTKVFPARLKGRRLPSGGAVELVLLREIETLVWECLAKPARRLAIGSRIEFGPRLQATLLELRANGLRVVRFDCSESWERVLDEVGQTPLPPYIKRAKETLDQDRDRYQTIYAKERGAIAAPTAGLHFTPEIFRHLDGCGVKVARITLHVGYGTFEPVRVHDISRHRVAAEWFTISEEAASAINRARQEGRRIVAVGTTTTRALESAAKAGGSVIASSGPTELTIIPGYQFRVVDALLTNFHLPQSSLLMLVSAFAEHELILKAYAHAVHERYRFYSYGDCMLII